MKQDIKIDDLQGGYDITYQSDANLENFFEPGKGYGEIEGNKLVGKDATGISWNADLAINENGDISFDAILNPKDGAENAFLLSKEGAMTKEPQKYNGVMQIIKIEDKTILTTRVKQGPITINVQFEKIK